MEKKILKSIFTLAAAVVVAVGATFAAFTSNTATISASSVATGTAEIKLCDTTFDTWVDTISPSLSLAGLAPGETDAELTAGKTIHLGNDDGFLHDNVSGECNGASSGSSVVDLDMIPKVVITSCDATLDDQFRLKFEVGTDQTTYKTLAEWGANTATVLPTFSPGESNQVKVFAELDGDATLQDTTCTFDITFDGLQPTVVAP